MVRFGRFGTNHMAMNSYVKNGHKGFLEMRRRRHMYQPNVEDKDRIAKREAIEWIEEKVADGKTVVPTGHLPMWRRLQVDRQYCLPKTEEGRIIGGLRIKVPNFVENDEGFPTHFRK